MLTLNADVRRVFVVQGRNARANEALFQFLRSIGLNPLEWTQAVGLTGQGSPYIGDVLHKSFSQAQAVVVLFSGDDEARLRPELMEVSDAELEGRLRPQPRPNVLFEAGMSFGRNPDRVIIVELGSLRSFSDIAGRHLVKINNTFGARNELAQRLSRAGCAVNTSGQHWIKAGDFDAAVLSPSDEARARQAELQSAKRRGALLGVALTFFLLALLFGYLNREASDLAELRTKQLEQERRVADVRTQLADSTLRSFSALCEVAHGTYEAGTQVCTLPSGRELRAHAP